MIGNGNCNCFNFYCNYISLDVGGIIHFELLPDRHTITGRSYAAQLQRLAVELEKKRPWRQKIYFHHDNTTQHVASRVKNKLEQLGWETIPHPPYSPDLAPSDYHLFRSLQHDLKSRRFQNEEGLKTYLKDFFDSKSPAFYARCIRDLPRRWQEVINSNGDYII